MTGCNSLPLVAVDVGNSRVKFGLFEPDDDGPARLPAPGRTLDLPPDEAALEAIADWLAPLKPGELAWWVGSVERTVASRLTAWLRGQATEQIVLLASADLPLEVRLPRPDMVGIDRLLAAVAANRLRQSSRPAIVVDLGTAITVDLISAEGAFLGGAILPGIGLAARALHEFTDLLPLLDMPGLAEAPPALGTATSEALRSGIYWGAVGGVRHLIELLSGYVTGEPQVYLTGGAAPSVAPLLSKTTAFEPNLVLSGIALVAGAIKPANRPA